MLSLLVTMLIGLWLIWPVRDDWAGSGETVAGWAGRAAERLSPAGDAATRPGRPATGGPAFRSSDAALHAPAGIDDRGATLVERLDSAARGCGPRGRRQSG